MHHRRRDYLGRGHSAAELASALRAGEFVRLGRGIYGEAGSWQTPEDRHRDLVAAMVPDLKAGSVLSHVTAGVLHDLWLPARALDRVQVVRAGKGGGSVSRYLHVHRGGSQRSVPAPGLEIEMTDLLTTTMDLLRQLPIADAVGVADSALRRGLDRDELLEELDRRRRVPGNRTARIAAEFANPRAESRGESFSRWRIHELGLPAPELQHDIETDAGEFVGRCDFWWRDRGLVGEFDGNVKYGRLLKPGQSVTDVVLAEKNREEGIRRQGEWLVRWTWREAESGDFFKIIDRGLTLAARRAG